MGEEWGVERGVEMGGLAVFFERPGTVIRSDRCSTSHPTRTQTNDGTK